MPHENATFPQTGLAKVPLRAWLLAARPRTLPLSISPILVASALALRRVNSIDWVLVVWALLCALCIQIGTNLINDALDFKKGADREGRLGPVRVTQAGLLSFRQVFVAGWVCFGAAFVCGIPLIASGGWPFAPLLLLAIACGYFYTGGPMPLSYTGISDLFVLVFFGWVSTSALYYLLTGGVDSLCWVAGTQLGCLAMVPHAVNNLRDHEADASANKRTLVVRFGVRMARWKITIISLLPFMISLLWIEAGAWWAAGLPCLCLPFVLRTVRAIWNTEPSPRYNAFLVSSALCAFSFGALLALGIFLS